MILSEVYVLFLIQHSSSTTQDHLSKLFKALESFYHPSNNGRYTVSCLIVKNFHWIG